MNGNLLPTFLFPQWDGDGALGDRIGQKHTIGVIDCG